MCDQRGRQDLGRSKLKLRKGERVAMTLDEFIARVRVSVQQTCFYHFTDRSNLVSIMRCGGLLSMAEIRRRGIHVPRPGGNQWSQDADLMSGVDAYVHLSFTNQSGMAHTAQQDGRIQNIVWLRIDPAAIKIPGTLITLDVANKRGVQRRCAAEAISDLDSDVIYTRMVWKDPDVYARLQVARKCEILIPDLIPTRYILNPNG